MSLTTLSAVRTAALLHDLILSQTLGVLVLGALHDISRSSALSVEVLDKGQAEGTATVHVSRKLGNGRLCIFLARKLDHASALGASIGLVLNLGTLDLSNG